MRGTKTLLIVAVLAVALLPAAGLACDKDAKTATLASADAKGHDCDKTACPKMTAETASLAKAAESGCAKSTATLIEMAKGASCPKTAALAAKAAEGDEQAKAILVAMYKSGEAEAGVDVEPSLNELATRASNGCTHSAAALIARAKSSGCARTTELAVKAESGDEASRAALIAMYAEPDERADAE